MGRAFDEVIGGIPETLRFSFGSTIEPSLSKIVNDLLSLPLLVVGSGGSLSAAHFIARVHEQKTGNMARPMSPLEMTFADVEPNRHGVLLLTASGNNKDILNSFDVAVEREFAYVGVICATLKSEILRKARQYTTHVGCFEYNNPKKDGFLAVNSLLSMCTLLCRAYDALVTPEGGLESFCDAKPSFNRNQLDVFLDRATKVALGGEWSLPAVIDLESKFSEAALGSVLISDLRNFGHGRHNWFDKRGEESALIVLDTPMLTALTKKTLSALPEIYPRMVLNTTFNGPLATIDLMRQVAYLVREAGKRFLIDPGRPGVPEYGRKIYHIQFLSRSKQARIKNRTAWLQRKCSAMGVPASSIEEFLDKFLGNLKTRRFGGIVFDYDGTLCDPSERFSDPQKRVGEVLNNLLTQGIIVGVATGRGGSVRDGLRSVVDKDLWTSCFVGNYNGSVISQLNVNIPNSKDKHCKEIEAICRIIETDPVIKEYATVKEQYKQASVRPKSGFFKPTILTRVSELLADQGGVKIVQSGHSIDILHRSVSKRLVVEAVQGIIGNTGGNVLVIGDQGQHGGNDFEMLSVSYSLSVDRVSTSPLSCWNLSPVGLRGVSATLALIQSINIDERSFRIDIDYLEREQGY